MKGPEHYAEAERLLAVLVAARAKSEGMAVEPLMALQVQAARQVTATEALAHATLAHTAAALLVDPGGAVNDGWATALGYTDPSESS